MNTLNELPQLMASALERGWAQLPEPTKPVQDYQVRRLRFAAHGLTQRGTERLKSAPSGKRRRYVPTGRPAHRPISHPEIHAHPEIQRLKGCGDRRKYHKVYMRLYRGMPVDDLMKEQN